MELKLSKREVDGVSIVDVAGRITAGAAQTALREAISDEVAKGRHKILINHRDVSYIDSSGLGEMVLARGAVMQTICAACGNTLFKDDDGIWEPCSRCGGSTRRPWGRLKLANAGRQVTDLLHFTKLDTVFEVHESEADALEHFSKHDSAAPPAGPQR
jgi:anti-sigma B factor antagonist